MAVFLHQPVALSYALHVGCWLVYLGQVFIEGIFKLLKLQVTLLCLLLCTLFRDRLSLVLLCDLVFDVFSHQLSHSVWFRGLVGYWLQVLVWKRVFLLIFCRRCFWPIRGIIL